MLKLTAETLDANGIINRATYPVSWNGRDYYRRKKAFLLTVDSQRAHLRVKGTRKEPYDVNVEVVENNGGRPIRISCDCPYAERDNKIVCKHKIAALLTLNDYLEEHAPFDWSSVLNRVLDKPKREAAPVPKHVLAFGLEGSGESWGFVPYILPIGEFTEEEIGDVEAMRQAVADRHIAGYAKRLTSRTSPQTITGAQQHHIALASILASQGDYYYYYKSGSVDAYAPILTDALVYLDNGFRHPLSSPISISTTPWVLEVEIDENEEGLHMDMVLCADGERLLLSDPSVQIVCKKPVWVLVSNQLRPLNETIETIGWMISRSALDVPADEKEEFTKNYLGQLAERYHLRGSLISGWDEIKEDPIPRLYLSEEEGDLVVELCFGYGEMEVPYEQHLPTQSVRTREDDPGALVRIHRKPTSEQSAWAILPTAKYGLKRGQNGALFLRSSVRPVDFLLNYLPKIAGEGYEVYGQEALKSVKVNRSRPTISFGVSSGIDWFDLQATVTFGDITVPFADIRKALKKREKFIKLSDGSIGQIPDDWVERFKYLFDMGKAEGETMRYTKTQALFLEQALSELDNVQIDEEYQRRMEKIRDFSKITPKPIPQGFVGELREYQKSGYDWLHFLHDYEFGGCLADDMGIGKTIQALSFLLSQKESGHSQKASLIVVPKSLLVNWERESARFTPDLKVLIHADIKRSKDLSVFDEYDVVLTTYGIMRRDLEIMRDYRFHYVILDESQAVKNPMADTSRSARLLNCDHRLVLTGTPVENSTIELWSQFDFLNPGHLGSFEYFRSEFAGPIERGQDDEAAQYLRSLVYPFILRRTKEQVAKELPPRTERVVYCEMEPAQKKAYAKYREEYRSMLMGMIEEEGINNTRMKILEGLLRLRQISNHPKLVDPTYHGPSAKFDMLMENLETLRREGHKALIFSQFTRMLKLVRTELKKRGIPFFYLDGKTQNRQDLVDQFQADPDTPFFLISLKAGGVGLNLTAADYVIHIDPWWNPAVERQATDRTHRIGQDKPVFVYKLIAKESVEEKILQLQERKKQLVDQLITTESSFFKSLTKDDIEVLFS